MVECHITNYGFIFTYYCSFAGIIKCIGIHITIGWIPGDVLGNTIIARFSYIFNLNPSGSSQITIFRRSYTEKNVSGIYIKYGIYDIDNYVTLYSWL